MIRHTLSGIRGLLRCSGCAGGPWINTVDACKVSCTARPAPPADGAAGVAPCGHPGVHVWAKYVQCLQGCDSAKPKAARPSDVPVTALHYTGPMPSAFQDSVPYGSIVIAKGHVTAWSPTLPTKVAFVSELVGDAGFVRFYNAEVRRVGQAEMRWRYTTVGETLEWAGKIT